jgi:hypothetical protein
VAERAVADASNNVRRNRLALCIDDGVRQPTVPHFPVPRDCYLQQVATCVVNKPEER